MVTTALFLLTAAAITVIAMHGIAAERRALSQKPEASSPVVRIKLRSWKWLIPLCFIGTCVYVCTPREYDVTSKFPRETGTRWCATEDLFVVRFPDTGLLYAEWAGSSADVPVSVDDWEAHPTDWHKQPKYAKTYENPYVRPGDIRAGVRRGAAFRVVKVVKDVNPEVGTSIDPRIVFEGSASRLGVVDAGLLRSYDFGASKRVTFAAATPCRTNGVKPKI